MLPRKDGSFETEMQVARFDDGGVGTVASFQLPLWWTHIAMDIPPWFTGKYKSKWLIFHGYVSLQKSVFERDSFKSKTLIVSKSPMVNQDPWKDHKIYM